MKSCLVEDESQFSSTDLSQRSGLLCCRRKVSSRFVTIMNETRPKAEKHQCESTKMSHCLKCDECRLFRSSLLELISRFSECCILRNLIQQIESVSQKFVSQASLTRQIDVKQITYRSCFMSCMSDKVKEDLSKNVKKSFKWSLSREENSQLRSECSSQKLDHSFCFWHYMLMQLSIIEVSYSILVSRRLSIRYVSRRCMIIKSLRCCNLSWKCCHESKHRALHDVCSKTRSTSWDQVIRSTTLLHFIDAVEQISEDRFQLWRDQNRETSFAEFNSFVTSSH